jgi:hypothetical protein
MLIMKNLLRFIILFISIFVISLILFQCGSDDNEDTICPEIDMDVSGVFPQNCDTLYRGTANEIIMSFSDNDELGSYSIDIHHNFDHHSHPTSESECNLSPKKEAGNALMLITGADIPTGLKTYLLDTIIEIPATVDTGDYHFMIQVTDKTGWSSTVGLGFKLVEKE